MAEMLLINPRKRRRAASTTAKRRRTTAKRRRNPVAARTVVMAAPRRARRRNPIAAYKRRKNPIRARRRRNPIGMGGGSVAAMLKGAVVGGAGAVVFDLAMGQVNKFLPPSMAKQAGKVGLYEILKFGLTVVAGKALSRSTRGLSVKMAQGAAVVQAYQAMSNFTGSMGMPLGYYSPAAVVQGNQRLNPIQVGQRRAVLNAYTRPGATPLLSRYTAPGQTQLLSAAAREGVKFR